MSDDELCKNFDEVFDLFCDKDERHLGFHSRSFDGIEFRWEGTSFVPDFSSATPSHVQNWGALLEYYGYINETLG